MQRKRFSRPAGLSLLACGALLALSGLLLNRPAGRALAQEKPATAPTLLLGYESGKNLFEVTKATQVKLRPNVVQPLFLALQNPGEAPLRNVTVKLVSVPPGGGPPEVLIQTTVAELKAGGPAQPVQFKPAPPAKPAAGPAGTPVPAPAPQLLSLAGPPYQLQVWLEIDEGKKAKEPAVVKLPVRIMQPEEYLDAKNISYDKTTRTLDVQVVSTDKFTGLPCPVDLVLLPRVIPGLVPVKTVGAYRQLLTEPKETVTLVAGNLQFQGATPPRGRIYIAADGYARAFQYITSFTGGSPTPLGDEKPRLRILAPRYAVPGAKYEVEVHVDVPRDRSYIVELGMDRAGGKEQFHPLQLLPGAREQRILVGLGGPGGAVVFKTSLQDWRTEVDTTGVYGKRYLRGRLLEVVAGGKTPEVVVLADESTGDDRHPLFDPELCPPDLARLTFGSDSNAVFAEVVLDGTPPQEVAFVGFQRQLVRGAPLVVKAAGRDKESGIRSVKFYVGKPLPDGKMPPDAPEAEAIRPNPAEDLWLAELPVSTEKKSRFDATVRFTNNAGLAAAQTITIELVEPQSKQGKKGARVIGKVTEGSLLQPNVPVTMTDPKGEVKGLTKTKADPPGVFVFENVMPGSYTVTAAKEATQTKGSAPVQVPADTAEVKGVEIKLRR